MTTQLKNVTLLGQYLSTLNGDVLTGPEIMEKFNWSQATFFRVIRAAPSYGYNIRNKRSQGYYLTTSKETFEGFTPEQLQSLAMMLQMQTKQQPEWQEQFGNLELALQTFLRNIGIEPSAWQGRIEYLPQHRRKVKKLILDKIASAVLQKKVIQFTYTNRLGETSQRTVHPQKLVIYRNGWSLDALDLEAVEKNGKSDSGLRQFALDRMARVQDVDAEWIEVDVKKIKKDLGAAYGLFAGTNTNTATIEFTGIAAEYVGREEWHPKQKQTWKSGNKVLVLQVPYATEQPDELIGDVLRWGEFAQIKKPAKLRTQWQEKIKEMAKLAKSK
jgi:predicted DNA-binding transcriptional regulator YafY